MNLLEISFLECEEEILPEKLDNDSQNVHFWQVNLELLEW